MSLLIVLNGVRGIREVRVRIPVVAGDAGLEVVVVCKADLLAEVEHRISLEAPRQLL